MFYLKRFTTSCEWPYCSHSQKRSSLDTNTWLAEARILTQPGLSGRLINQTSFHNAFSSSLQIDLIILLQPPSMPTQNWQNLHLFLMSVASVVFKIVLLRAYLPAHPGELDCNFLASYKVLLLPGQPYFIEELSQLHVRTGRERKRELVGRG